MTSQQDIILIKRRLAHLEGEFRDLKQRVAILEATGAAAEKSSRPFQADTEADIAPHPAIPQDVPPVLSTPSAAGEPVYWSSPLPPAAPSVARESHPLREWLEPLQLWPPVGEANAEVRLAAWWATRIGALLAVIGIVFLGIYVSREAPPWVRLAEVAAATGLFLGAGLWLERRLPTFGAVVFGAGLALAYFCAFAAYGVPAMKVIHAPFVAMTCELAVVAGIFAAAWRRNSPVAATVAVILGHVTALLALRAPTGFGPWVVLLLGVASVGLRSLRSWDAPSLVALPLTWLFLFVAGMVRAPALALSTHGAWLWASLYFMLFAVRDWSVARRGGELSTLDRAVQVANSTFAVAGGLLLTGRGANAPLMEFYFGSGLLLLGAAWAWQRAGASALVPVFVCKGAGLLALGVIAGFDGQARYLVLLAQAFVMLVSARQSHLRGLRVATIVAGVVALAFYVGDASVSAASALNTTTLVEVAFLGGALAFVAAMGRWLQVGRTGVAIGGTIVGCVSVLTVLRWNFHGMGPAMNVGIALVLVLAGGSLRGWLAAAAGATPLLLAAHAQMWLATVEHWGRENIWFNELVVLLAAGGALAGLARWRGHDRANQWTSGLIASGSAATLGTVCFETLSPAGALLAASGLVLALAGVWRATRVAVVRQALVALLALAWLMTMRLASTPSLQGWTIALGASLAFAMMTILLPFAIERDSDETQRRQIRWFLAGAGLVAVFVVFFVQRGELASFVTVACGVSAVATFLVGLAARSRPHRLCGLAGLALCIPRAFVHDLDSTLHRIAAFVVLGVVLLWVGFSYHRFRHLIDDDEKKL